VKPIEEEKEKTELLEQALREAQSIYGIVTTSVPDNLIGLGLTCIQLKALLALSSNRPLRMGDMANALGKDQRTATGIVDRLVSRGMVERVHKANDRRVVLCQLSDKGWKAIRQIFEVQETTRDRMRSALRQMSARELRHVTVALREVISHLRKDSDVILVALPLNNPELSIKGEKKRQVLGK